MTAHTAEIVNVSHEQDATGADIRIQPPLSPEVYSRLDGALGRLAVCIDYDELETRGYSAVRVLNERGGTPGERVAEIEELKNRMLQIADDPGMSGMLASQVVFPASKLRLG